MLSLIIPTFNEKDNIPILIKRLQNVLQPTGPYEIIIVDDDSPDLTWDVAEKLSHNIPELRVIRRIGERGLSSAVIRGFQAAKGDVLGVMDADLQHDEVILPKMWKAIPVHPIVVASRHTDGGSTGQWQGPRVWISYLGRALAKNLLGVNLTDPMSGFFMIRREIFQEVAPQLNPKGFKIFLEIVHRSQIKDVHEVGYSFRLRENGQSKLNAKVGLQYLQSLYDLVLGDKIPRRFWQFCLVGFSGVLVNMAVLGLINNFTHAGPDLALMGGIGISMITNYLLNNFWTFSLYSLTGASKLLIGFLSFASICFFGALINYSVAIVLFEKIGINLYLANFLGILLSAVWNYGMTAKVTWKAQV